MPRRRRPPRAGALGEFPPLRIASQIAILQVIFYALAVVLLVFTTLVAGTPFSLNLLLGWEGVRGDTTQGWLMAFVWFFDGGFCMAVAIVALIARSKLVPDFALTTQFLHLLIVSLYTRSLPRHAMWWATSVASAGLAVALGIWGCRYRELQPIFFGGGRILGGGDDAPAQQQDGGGGGGQGSNEDGDEEMGYARGSRRGRGRDGAGEHEMAKLEPSGS